MNAKKCVVRHCDAKVQSGGLCSNHLQRRKKYRLSVAGEEHLVQRADGQCEICGRRSDRTLHTDLNHATRKVRGSLCHQCNVGLGMFHEDIEAMKKAIAWIESDGVELPDWAYWDGAAAGGAEPGSRHAEKLYAAVSELGPAVPTGSVARAVFGKNTLNTRATTRRGLNALARTGKVRLHPGGGRTPDLWSVLAGEGEGQA